MDGNVETPPGETLDEIYRWLGKNDYVPHSFKWLDYHEGRRRRRQVYIHEPREMPPNRRLTHKQAWDLQRGYTLGEL